MRVVDGNLPDLSAAEGADGKLRLEAGVRAGRVAWHLRPLSAALDRRVGSFQARRSNHVKDRAACAPSCSTIGRACCVSFLAIGTTMAFYIWAAYIPNLLRASGRISASTSFLASTFGLIAYSVSMPISGALADRVGRRLVLGSSWLLFAALFIPMIHYALGNPELLPWIMVAAMSLIGMGSGAVAASFAEQFPTSVRAIGWGCPTTFPLPCLAAPRRILAPGSPVEECPTCSMVCRGALRHKWPGGIRPARPQGKTARLKSRRAEGPVQAGCHARRWAALILVQVVNEKGLSHVNGKSGAHFRRRKRLGAAAARRLATDGFKVAILSSSGKGEALANELGGIGVTGSNQSNDDLQRLVDAVMRQWGASTCWSTAAATGRAGRFWKSPTSSGTWA